MRKPKQCPKVIELVREEFETKHSVTVIFNIFVINKNNNPERIPLSPLQLWRE